MRILLFGATGLLGQALARVAARRGDAIVGVARRGADRAVDLATAGDIAPLIAAETPDLVINAAALTNLDACEADPKAAHAINAGAVGSIAEACRNLAVRFIHVSTDHFFTGDRDRPHAEGAEVVLVNEYARSKFAGEALAMRDSAALVVRTNLTGPRGWAQPTFFEWAADALTRRLPMTLFDDFYTSTIDADTLAAALLDLADARAAGRLNVASRQVSHKKEFVQALAGALGIQLDWATTGSVRGASVRRAESLGLDVSRAEAILGYRLPDLPAVAHSLASQWRQAA
jgi:dTDP-4-dehydrorhamnose reductase